MVLAGIGVLATPAATTVINAGGTVTETDLFNPLGPVTLNGGNLRPAAAST